MDKIIVPLDNGYRIAIEKCAGEFDKEVNIYIEDSEKAIIQDLAVVRPAYKVENGNVKFRSDLFEILIWGSAELEDYTDKFVVPLYEENDE